MLRFSMFWSFKDKTRIMIGVQPCQGETEPFPNLTDYRNLSIVFEEVRTYLQAKLFDM